ncbi:MAG: diacylglycerol kinase family protein [Dehalococcoidia bacterium]
MSATHRRAVVIANPAARRALSPGALESAAAAVRARGWDVTIEAPDGRADAIARAEAHARSGVDALLACGGDGSLGVVVRGVTAAGADTPTAVGVIPAGTANVWAAETGVPRETERALALIEDGVRRRVDLGWARIGAGERVPFLLVCGAGLDAAVVRAVEARPAWKRRAGRLAFALPALTALTAWPATEALVTIDGEELRPEHLLLALAGNAHRYGGVAALSARSALDDGLLDVALFEGAPGLRARLALVAQALRGRLDERTARGVTHRRAARVTIAPARPMPVEVDGDYLGECSATAPLELEVAPGAITVIAGR